MPLQGVSLFVIIFAQRCYLTLRSFEIWATEHRIHMGNTTAVHTGPYVGLDIIKNCLFIRKVCLFLDAESCGASRCSLTRQFLETLPHPSPPPPPTPSKPWKFWNFWYWVILLLVAKGLPLKEEVNNIIVKFRSVYVWCGCGLSKTEQTLCWAKRDWTYHTCQNQSFEVWIFRIFLNLHCYLSRSGVEFLVGWWVVVKSNIDIKPNCS